MTNPDWTDRTLPVTERVAIAQAEIADRSDLYILLEDCSVVLRQQAETGVAAASALAMLPDFKGQVPMGTVEEVIAAAQRNATGPKGEPWFPRD